MADSEIMGVYPLKKRGPLQRPGGLPWPEAQVDHEFEARDPWYPGKDGPFQGYIDWERRNSSHDHEDRGRQSPGLDRLAASASCDLQAAIDAEPFIDPHGSHVPGAYDAVLTARRERFNAYIRAINARY